MHVHGHYFGNLNPSNNWHPLPLAFIQSKIFREKGLKNFAYKVDSIA